MMIQDYISGDGRRRGDGERAGERARWMRDDASDRCLLCERSFTLTRRRHHCRRCFRLACASCSAYEATWGAADVASAAGAAAGASAGPSTVPRRVCRDCFVELGGVDDDDGDDEEEEEEEEEEQQRQEQPDGPGATEEEGQAGGGTAVRTRRRDAIKARAAATARRLRKEGAAVAAALGLGLEGMASSATSTALASTSSNSSKKSPLRARKAGGPSALQLLRPPLAGPLSRAADGIEEEEEEEAAAARAASASARRRMKRALPPSLGRAVPVLDRHVAGSLLMWDQRHHRHRHGGRDRLVLRLWLGRAALQTVDNGAAAAGGAPCIHHEEGGAAAAATAATGAAAAATWYCTVWLPLAREPVLQTPLAASRGGACAWDIEETLLLPAPGEGYQGAAGVGGCPRYLVVDLMEKGSGRKGDVRLARARILLADVVETTAAAAAAAATMMEEEDAPASPASGPALRCHRLYDPVTRADAGRLLARVGFQRPPTPRSQHSQQQQQHDQKPFMLLPFPSSSSAAASGEQLMLPPPPLPSHPPLLQDLVPPSSPLFHFLFLPATTAATTNTTAAIQAAGGGGEVMCYLPRGERLLDAFPYARLHIRHARHQRPRAGLLLVTTHRLIHLPTATTVAVASSKALAEMELDGLPSQIPLAGAQHVSLTLPTDSAVALNDASSSSAGLVRSSAEALAVLDVRARDSVAYSFHLHAAALCPALAASPAACAPGETTDPAAAASGAGGGAAVDVPALPAVEARASHADADRLLLLRLRAVQEEIQHRIAEDDFAFPAGRGLCPCRPASPPPSSSLTESPPAPSSSSSSSGLSLWERELCRLGLSLDRDGAYGSPQRGPLSSIWRISRANLERRLCPTYPPLLAVPASVSDAELREAAAFRSRQRLPVLTWLDPRTGAALCRSSQPLVGLTSAACPEDDRLLLEIRAATAAAASALASAGNARNQQRQRRRRRRSPSRQRQEEEQGEGRGKGAGRQPQQPQQRIPSSSSLSGAASAPVPIKSSGSEATATAGAGEEEEAAFSVRDLASSFSLLDATAAGDTLMQGSLHHQQQHQEQHEGQGQQRLGSSSSVWTEVVPSSSSSAPASGGFKPPAVQEGQEEGDGDDEDPGMASALLTASMLVEPPPQAPSPVFYDATAADGGSKDGDDDWPVPQQQRGSGAVPPPVVPPIAIGVRGARHEEEEDDDLLLLSPSMAIPPRDGQPRPPSSHSPFSAASSSSSLPSPPPRPPSQADDAGPSSPRNALSHSPFLVPRHVAAAAAASDRSVDEEEDDDEEEEEAEEEVPAPILRILDARPVINAVGNAFMGKGSEVISRLGGEECTTLAFLNIANIHAMRDSHLALLALCHEAKHLDEWGFHGHLHDSKWLQHVATILKGAVLVARHLAEGSSVLVHCSDGWDRTTQLCVLAQLMVDPHYRTLAGFETLIEKEFCLFGHQFRLRAGAGCPRDQGEAAPIFLQCLDAVWQLLRQFPTAFEFTPDLLLLLADAHLSRWFPDFCYDSDRERRHYLQSMPASSSSIVSVWAVARGCADRFRNPLYQPPPPLPPPLAPAAGHGHHHHHHHHHHHLRPRWEPGHLALWRELHGSGASTTDAGGPARPPSMLLALLAVGSGAVMMRTAAQEGERGGKREEGEQWDVGMGMGMAAMASRERLLEARVRALEEERERRRARGRRQVVDA